MADERFKDQNYSQLRKHHQELGVPWTDPLFPASDTSIGIGKLKELPRDIEWKRPIDLCKDPQLFVDGASSHDANQGKLGNCWFVAATSVLAGSKPLWERVIPDGKDQEWPTDEEKEEGKHEYSGVFRFRFWRFGKWVEVVVDDLLPTAGGELLFSHSTDNNEFWGALLEKAYAKLHGSYEVLDGGNLSDALVDFTSGVSEVINLDDEKTGYRTEDPERKKSLFKVMASEIEEHALMCCAVKATSAAEMESRTDLGLVRGHAYGITAVKKVQIGGTNLMSFFKGREKLYLVRLQNPWGAKEWTGPFSDSAARDFLFNCLELTRLLSRSPEWSNISEKEREKLGLTFNDDGEFWMPFDDFLHQFTELSICRIINTSVFSFTKTWDEATESGAWSVTMDRAGGCLNHPDTILNNPQYRFNVYKDEDEVIIQLSQQDCRERIAEKRQLLVIGFHIMKVEGNRKYRVHKVQAPAATSDYIKTKHIFLRTTLEKGRYVLVPTTFKQGETTEFLLRMFTDEKADLTALKEDYPSPAWYQCCSAPYAMVTRVTVKSARGLENKETIGKADPYCLIKCEGQSVRSDPVDDNLSPTWNCTGIFYRRKVDVPVKIQIWNHNIVMDTFMGQALELMTPCESTGHLLELFGRRSKKTEKVSGSITIEVETYEDLAAI